jgi:hypothetical protein
MYKRMTLSNKEAASKIKKPKILKKETKNGQHGLISSLHKWGEDYYEKPVKNIPKKN